MTDYEFIKGFQEIKISKICEDKIINASNLLNGRTTDENYKKVKDEIIRELLMLIIKDKKEDLIGLSLYDDLLKKLEEENQMLRRMI